MTILKAAIMLGALAVPAIAFAHTPVSVPYETRGQCEAQLAKDNIFHARDKIAQGAPEYDTVGEAVQDMHDHFWCEQDPDDGYWYMLREPF
ncbi:MAG TPA: hypothetical protein VFK58_08335 [Sphingomicrobium sp.]|nr:hypothetical protein [Sphingomicrobium sp.]